MKNQQNFSKFQHCSQYSVRPIQKACELEEYFHLRYKQVIEKFGWVEWNQEAIQALTKEINDQCCFERPINGENFDWKFEIDQYDLLILQERKNLYPSRFMGIFDEKGKLIGAQRWRPVFDTYFHELEYEGGILTDHEGKPFPKGGEYIECHRYILTKKALNGARKKHLGEWYKYNASMFLFKAQFHYSLEYGYRVVYTSSTQDFVRHIVNNFNFPLKVVGEKKMKNGDIVVVSIMTWDDCLKVFQENDLALFHWFIEPLSDVLNQSSIPENSQESTIPIFEKPERPKENWEPATSDKSAALFS